MTGASGHPVLTKRVLIAISHAVERFALAAEPRDPMVVIALFQRSSYFEREATVYRDIAARGAVTIVGLVEDFPPRTPPGVHHQPLAEDDALAREWNVTVLGPHGGATLVAVDQESVAPGAAPFEHGRRFRCHWSFRRADAVQQVLRLRSQLRLPPTTNARIDGVLRAVAAVPEPRGQSWWEAPLRSLAQDIERAARSRDRAVTRGEGDRITGLPTGRDLARWTARLGRGTLPVGLVVLRLLDAELLRARYGIKLELTAVQTAARTLQGLIGGAERLVQLGRHDFLFVVPSARPPRIAALCRAARVELARLDQRYPFVGLRVTTRELITRDRPLPVTRMLEELAQVQPRQDPDPVR
jgi:DICT domain-containing protein/GGDEF domain-containing protein